MIGIFYLYDNFYRQFSQNHWLVERYTFILILSYKKTIMTLASCSITQIVTQKGVFKVK